MSNHFQAVFGGSTVHYMLLIKITASLILPQNMDMRVIIYSIEKGPQTTRGSVGMGSICYNLGGPANDYMCMIGSRQGTYIYTHCSTKGRRQRRDIWNEWVDICYTSAATGWLAEPHMFGNKGITSPLRVRCVRKAPSWLPLPRKSFGGRE